MHIVGFAIPNIAVRFSVARQLHHHIELPIVKLRGYQSSIHTLFSSESSNDGCGSLEVEVPNIIQSREKATYEEPQFSRSAEQAKKFVIVRRNRQSMAFRNGSQLIFSRAIESTFEKVILTDDSTANNEINKLYTGSFVGVIINGKSGKNNTKRKSSYGKGSKKKLQEKNEVESECKHHVIGNESEGDVIGLSNDAKLIGFGVYNPNSMYRVRILCHQLSHPYLFQQVEEITKRNKGSDENAIDALKLIVESKLEDAIRARTLMNVPSMQTDTYRLFNGEGDGLSGIAIDILGGCVAVIMSSAVWCETYKHHILEVVDNVLKENHPQYKEQKNFKVIWRNTPSRLKQDGLIIKESSEIKKSDSEHSTPVLIQENGIKYTVYPFDESSQKTGFYCDQRENRNWLSSLCKDKRVLDLCCYNGGFALNAIVNGYASSCTGVDSSPIAISNAIDNSKLNEVSTEGSNRQIEFVQNDIAHFMNDAMKNSLEYDVIILDPPKLAPTVSGLDRAARKYHSLNRDACKLINSKEGGLLLSCTCSGAMTQKDGGQFFLETVKSAALAAGRQITLLKTNGAASCHTQCPSSFPAGAYLTASLFYVSPTTNNSIRNTKDIEE